MKLDIGSLFKPLPEKTTIPPMDFPEGETCPISCYTFTNLIAAQHTSTPPRPYVVALLQDSINCSTFYDGQSSLPLLGNGSEQNPINRATIEKVHYFVLQPGKTLFTHLLTYSANNENRDNVLKSVKNYIFAYSTATPETRAEVTAARTALLADKLISLSEAEHLTLRTIDLIDRVVANPNDAVIYAHLGDLFRVQEKFDDAITHLKKAIKLDPNFALAHGCLGDVFRLQEKFDDAITHLQKAIELDRNYARAHASLGDVFKQQQKLDDAVTHFKKAVELDPNYARSHARLGDVFRQQGQLDGAVTHLKKAIELNPNNASTHVCLGDAFRQQGQLDDAVTHLKKATELDPNYAPAHACLGRVFRQQGQFDDAVTHLKKAIKLDPNFAHAHACLGEMCRQQG